MLTSSATGTLGEPTPDSKTTEAARFLVLQLLIAFLYAAFVFLLRKTLPLEFLSVAWPASGLSLALLLRTRRRNVVGIWLGATISCLLIGRPVQVAMLIGFGNALGAWAGVTALRQLVWFDPAIGSARSYFALVAVAGTIGSSMHAAAATVGLYLHGALPAELTQPYFIRGWMANIMGAVLIAPVILSWWDDVRDKRVRLTVHAETIALFVLLFLVGQIVFIHWFHDEFGYAIRGYWLFLLMAAIGIRVGIRGVELALLMVAIQGLIAATNNRFLTATPEENQLLIYWFFTLALAVTGMSITTFFTERQRTLNQVRHMQKRLETVLNSMHEGVYEVDTQGHCVFVNQAFLQTLGYQHADQVLGTHIHELIHHSHTDGSHYPSEDCRMYQVLASGASVNIRDEVFWHKDGHPVPVEYWSRPIVQDGKITGAIATFVENSQQQLRDAQLQRWAFHDPLTSLPNRRLFLDRLQQTLAQVQRSGGQGALVFADLDRFKAVNDQHGHDAGDALLVEVAKRIRRSLREVDTVARLGGDEFVVLLGEFSHGSEPLAQRVAIVADKIRVSLNAPYHLELRNRPVDLTCSTSIGITLFDPSKTDAELILAGADRAMYQSKAEGGNRVTFEE